MTNSINIQLVPDKHLQPVTSKTGRKFEPSLAVGVPVVLGEYKDRVEVAVPSWQRILLHPEYDKAQLSTLVEAAAAQRPVEIDTRLGREISHNGSTFRPTYVHHVTLLLPSSVEVEVADDEGEEA